MNENTSQCDATRLRRYLAGELAASEESGVIQHLDNCPHCQREIESLAASADEWNDIRSLLTPVGSAPRAVSRSMIAGLVVSAGETSPSDLAAACAMGEGRLEFLAPTDDPEMLGRLGPYEIKGLVGQGGMGLVLKAYDRALQRTVAIKVLSPHLATNPTARRRFAREAQAAAAVAHEHVIAIHAVAEASGLPYLVMPYMPGQSLQQRLDEVGPLAPVEVLRISSQIAAGLAAAHAQGLVHRDIKPANILLEQGIERVAITDFGLARAIDDASLTRTGVLAGTPAYMSPEQARGEAVDHRADLFSLGSVMYAMCAGRPPFRAESTVAVLKRICEENATPLAHLNADIPLWLAGIIERLHAKAPANRFASAAEVADLLQRCLAHVQNPTAVLLPPELQTPGPAARTTSSTKRLWIGTGVLAAVSLAAALLWQPWSNNLITNQDNLGDTAKPTDQQEGQSDGATIQAPREPSGDGKNVESAVAPLITDADYQSLEDSFKSGRIDDPETLYQWSMRLKQVKQSAYAENERDSPLLEHLRRMQRLEELVEERGTPAANAAAKFYRLEAQAELTEVSLRGNQSDSTKAIPYQEENR
jgi:serine/threonine protein kinase